MEFWVTIIGLVRRPWVIVPAVLASLALGALAYLGTPVTYVSSTTMVLTTTEYGGTLSQDPATPTPLTNPMLNFNDSLRTTSAILIQTMNTKDVAVQLGATGPTQLVVDDGRTNPELLGLNGPFLYVVARSTSAAEAKRVVVEAQRLMRERLREWQTALKAPQNTYVGLVDVVAPTAPTPDRSRATKLAVVAFLFGFVLSIGIAYFGHRVRSQRRNRAAARRSGGGAGPPDADDLPEVVPTPRRPAVDPTFDPTFDPTLDPAVGPAVTAAPREPEADPAVGPAVTAAPREPEADPAALPTARRPETEPAAVPVPFRGEAQQVLVRVPVKTQLRSRNR